MLALKGILKNMAKGKKRKGSRDTRVAKKKPVTKKLESSKAGTDKTVPSKRVKRKVVATNKQNGVYSAMKSSISVIDFVGVVVGEMQKRIDYVGQALYPFLSKIILIVELFAVKEKGS